MKKIPSILSKTKLMRGFRCLKAIYLTIHRPDLEPPITPELQALFDQGNEVGEVARAYFPGGTLIENKPWEFAGAVAATKKCLEAGVDIIYEAAFEYAGCYARVDILRYSKETKKYDLYEVKSTTKVKPEHLEDVGLQTWIVAKSNIPLQSINIVHLNNTCRSPDLSTLFTIENVTEKMRENYLTMQPTLSNILNTLKQPTVPEIEIGAHCEAPTECQFKSFCWQEKKIPEMSIFNLPGIYKTKWALYKEGVIQLDDARLTDLTDLQARIIHSYKTNERFINPTGIQVALKKLIYPLIFLDFETINFAIPKYEGTSPYQQVPFQFSVHTKQSPDAAITHAAYLHENETDPRPLLMPALLKACGQSGSIIAYYGKFESDRIKEMAAFFPAYSADLLALTERIFDPLEVIKENIYDNAFMGSFSLKKVAPGLLGNAHSYDDLEIANGGDAQRGFLRLISKNIASEEKNKLKTAMLKYCEQDTHVMVALLDWLHALR